jgi:hypothetical protein
MDPIERRDFLKGTATGVFAFTVGGVAVLLSPRDARAQKVPFRLPQRRRGPNHEALGETLVPGARAAGIAHFVDQQLSVPPRAPLTAIASAFGCPTSITRCFPRVTPV